MQAVHCDLLTRLARFCGCGLAMLAAVSCGRRDESASGAAADAAQTAPADINGASGNQPRDSLPATAPVAAVPVREPVKLGGQSLTELGIRYAEGRGVAKDAEAATALFRRAAAEGDAEALYRLGLGAREGRLENSEGDAASYFRRAADSGQVEAMFQVGEALRGGDESSVADAAAWYRRAASRGHLEAMHRLSDMYARGEGLEQSDRAAAFWLSRAEAGTKHPEPEKSGRPTVVTPFGDLIDPVGDVQVTASEGKLSMIVPEGQRDLVPSDATAPRVLQPRHGEFQLEVTVAGDFFPVGETAAASAAGVRAAALVLCESDSSFVRLDRGCKLGADAAQHHCEFRIFKDGSQAFQQAFDVENKLTLLRLARRGGRIRAEFSQDGGQNWTLFRSQPSTFADAVQVGIAVVNTTPARLSVEFTGLPQSPVSNGR
jgi:hypothetical protein